MAGFLSVAWCVKWFLAGLMLPWNPKEDEQSAKDERYEEN